MPDKVPADIRRRLEPPCEGEHATERPPPRTTASGRRSPFRGCTASNRAEAQGWNPYLTWIGDELCATQAASVV